MNQDKSTPEPAVERQPAFLAAPRTTTGWWSVGLATLCLLIMGIIVSGVLQRLPTEPSWLAPQAVVPCLGLGMLASGLAADATGLIALVSHKERSWLVFLLSVPIGLLALFVFLAGIGAD